MKPEWFKPHLESIPDELKQLSQWVVHRDKKPYNPATGQLASTTDPKTWGSFEQSVEVARRFDGIGFVFTKDDPYVGIDLDKVIEDDVIEDWAEEIVNDLNSYTELSPSGRGVHIIVRSDLTVGAKKGRVEAYSHSRYFTMTGNRWNLEYEINEA